MNWRDLADLVRAPAALSVPGDVVAGAAAAGALGPAAGGLAAASVCLYWAGMAANDWADRDLDARERPERPIPSGRIEPGQALAVAGGLTAAGIGIAALAGGRRALAVALPLAGAVWAYDLWAKNTPAGPAAMAVCRGLDVLLGATGGKLSRAAPAAATVAAHTYTVTALSRREVSGATAALPAVTLTGTLALAGTVALAAKSAAARSPNRTSLRAPARPGGRPGRPGLAGRANQGGAAEARWSWRSAGSPATLTALLAGWYAVRYGMAQAQAVSSPSPATVRAAVGAGITGLPALQAALTARAGSTAAAVAVAAAAPLGRRLARVVSPT